MKRLWAAFLTLSPLTQIGLVLAPLVVMALVSGGVGGCVSKIKDARFDKAQAEREAQISAITTERNEAVGRAQAWERRAKDLEAQVAINETIAKAEDARAKAAKAELEKEDERYKQEVEAAGEDIDSCTRLERICERAKQLGLYPKTKSCACTNAQ
jgi:hypothetical protein